MAGKKKKGKKGKKGKKEEKEITISEKKQNKMEGKTYYLRSTFNSSYLDCDNIGDVYFSLSDPCKWEFIKTDLPGTYFMKHVNTQLFLTSNERGDIFTTVELNNSFQKWSVFSAGPENFAYQNLSNELFFHVNNKDVIYLDENPDAQGLFNTFQRFPKK